MKKAFVLMPFRAPYNSYYSRIYRPALESVDYNVVRADELYGSHPIIDDIQKSIKESDLILCDMSTRNPNVFYELGLAHAIGKPVILVSNNIDDIPFDLKHVRTIIYETDEAGWEGELYKSIANYAAEKSLKIYPEPLMPYKEQYAEESQFEKLGHTVRSFGIANIIRQWTELSQFDGNVGREFKERLQGVKAPATWYIITMSPEAFSGAAQLTLMEEAANRGIHIKWAYQTPELVLAEPALQVQWKWINSRYDDIEERATPKTLHNHLQSHIAVVEERIHKWEKALKRMSPEERQGSGKWEVYYSRAPNFYLTWLSVPGKHSDDMPLEAPPNTFGFVHLYVFFPTSYEARPALYFDNKSYPSDNSQEILNYYYRSTVKFFSNGVKQECNYLPDSPKQFPESS